MEIAALEQALGRERLRRMPIVSTKACTGHLMGAGMEDLVSIACLREQRLPKLDIPDLDPAFADLRFAAGEERYPCEYAVHVAAGIGSHVAVVVARGTDVVDAVRVA